MIRAGIPRIIGEPGYRMYSRDIHKLYVSSHLTHRGNDGRQNSILLTTDDDRDATALLLMVGEELVDKNFSTSHTQTILK
jgi:hypothetical protein